MGVVVKRQQEKKLRKILKNLENFIRKVCGNSENKLLKTNTKKGQKCGSIC